MNKFPMRLSYGRKEIKMAEVTKEQAVKVLTNKKYIAQNDKGVIMVSYAAGDNYKKILEDVKKILKAAGFEGSFGVRPISGKEYSERAVHDNTMLDEDIIEEDDLGGENQMEENLVKDAQAENVSKTASLAKSAVSNERKAVKTAKAASDGNHDMKADATAEEEYYDDDEEDDYLEEPIVGKAIEDSEDADEKAKRKATFIDSLDDFDSFSFGDGMQMSLFDDFD